MNGDNIFQKLWTWFVVSSADPNKIALTVKGLLLSVLPLILIVVRARGIEIGEGNARIAIDNVEQLIIAVFGVVAAIVTAIGAGRKVVNTVRGK